MYTSNSAFNDSIRQLKSTVSMSDVLYEHCGLRPNRNGFVCCPFHNERTASFKVDREKGHCFGCGWNGDIIDFVASLYNVSTANAMRRLGITLSENNFGSSRRSIKQIVQGYKVHEQAEQVNALRKKYEQQKAHTEGLLDLEAVLDKWQRELKPKPGEEIDLRYAKACKDIDELRNDIGVSLTREYELKQKLKAAESIGDSFE